MVDPMYRLQLESPTLAGLFNELSVKIKQFPSEMQQIAETTKHLLLNSPAKSSGDPYESPVEVTLCNTAVCEDPVKNQQVKQTTSNESSSNSEDLNGALNAQLKSVNTSKKKGGRPSKTPLRKTADLILGDPELVSQDETDHGQTVAPELTESAPVSEQSNEVQAATLMGYDDARKALQDLSVLKDIVVAKSVLAQFGARKVSDVPQDQIADFVQACKAQS